MLRFTKMTDPLQEHPPGEPFHCKFI